MIRDSGLVMEEYPDEMYLDKSPEYWSGWALAYYQWYRGRTFSRIYRAVSMTEIRNMYEVYHEMDLAHFVERLDELWTNTLGGLVALGVYRLLVKLIQTHFKE